MFENENAGPESRLPLVEELIWILILFQISSKYSILDNSVQSNSYKSLIIKKLEEMFIDPAPPLRRESTGEEFHISHSIDMTSINIQNISKLTQSGNYYIIYNMKMKMNIEY